MKKDFTRDYITEAFRLYAAMGRPTYEKTKQRIYDTAILQHQGLEPSAAIINAETTVNKAAPMLLDILAVEKTIELLLRGGRAHIVKAVEAVYFACPEKPLLRCDISSRVHKFSMEFPASERSVYLWLKEARLLCAATRGLRIDAAAEKEYRITKYLQ